MNIANQLTILRIFLAFICMGLILNFSFSSLVLGLIIFILSSLTDYFDGYLARKRNIISDLGKILDPIADKILVLGVFLAFLEKGLVNSWLVILIMIREFFITGLRIFALRQGKVMEAQSFGKHKTVTQITSIIIILILLIIERVVLNLPQPWVWFEEFRSITTFWAMVWVAIVTVGSGVIYLWKNRLIIKSL